MFFGDKNNSWIWIIVIVILFCCCGGGNLFGCNDK